MRARRAVALGLASGAIAAVGARAAGGAIAGMAERRYNRLHPSSIGDVSEAARDLHRRLTIVDLHADSLLWGRDLLRRSTFGHVDVPRLIEGNVALQVLAAPTKVSGGVNLEHNDDRGDDVRLLGLAQFWPPATWSSLLARALHLAARARRAADRSDGAFGLIMTRADLAAYLARRGGGDRLAAGLLAIEGAQALEADPANLELVADAGFRMIGVAHFFDNAFGGSAHGMEQGGLTRKGRELVERAEARRVIVDVAHSSARTIDDVLSMARRPVVSSHGGVQSVLDNPRNLADDQLRGIAETGGLVGIGFWPAACGGDTVESIVSSIAHAASVIGVDRVALGSDWDGAVTVPFDAAGIVALTDRLLARGFDETAIEAIMGANAVRLFEVALP